MQPVAPEGDNARYPEDVTTVDRRPDARAAGRHAEIVGGAVDLARRPRIRPQRPVRTAGIRGHRDRGRGTRGAVRDGRGVRRCRGALEPCGGRHRGTRVCGADRRDRASDRRGTGWRGDSPGADTCRSPRGRVGDPAGTAPHRPLRPIRGCRAHRRHRGRTGEHPAVRRTGEPGTRRPRPPSRGLGRHCGQRAQRPRPVTHRPCGTGTNPHPGTRRYRRSTDRGPL